MFNLHISNAFVHLELNEIFDRPEHVRTPEQKEQAASYAWFEIYGMYRLIKLGGQMSFSRLEKRNDEYHKEYERLLKTLEAALTKAEKVYDEYRCRT